MSEIHYANGGTDANEFVEVSGPAGLSLAGYTLVRYNGQNGRVYGDTVALNNSILDEGSGYGALAFNVSLFQNGPDGIALVSRVGDVVDFISYESAAFPATNGPARGRWSTVMVNAGGLPVNEGSHTLPTESLQLVGEASNPTWAGPLPASAGRLNDGFNLRA